MDDTVKSMVAMSLTRRRAADTTLQHDASDPKYI